ncbi:MAG: hypothetical protein ACJ8G3_22960 [Burkholderiaceae bacterium]
MLPANPGKPSTMPAGSRMGPAMELAMRHGVFLIVHASFVIRNATQQRSNAATQRDAQCAMRNAPPRMITQP